MLITSISGTHANNTLLDVPFGTRTTAQAAACTRAAAGAAAVGMGGHRWMLQMGSNRRATCKEQSHSCYTLVWFSSLALLGFPVGFSSRASLHLLAQEGLWMSGHCHDPRDPKALLHGGRKEIFSAQSSTSLCFDQVSPWVAQKQQGLG